MKKFNREKALRKIEFKRKWRSYSRYVYIAVPCVLCCLLCLYFAYSKFFVSEEQAVIRTTVGDFIHGDIIGAYIDGEYSSTIPGKNDGYVVDKVSCDNGAVGKWNNDKWGLLTTNLSKRTKCNVYFKKVVSKVPDIIAQLDTSGKCPSVNADGSVNVTGVEATNGYLCKAKDAYGDSYYYRGNVTNNYVKFADKYWRIVRINGDGTVRVIYDGTSAHATVDGSADRIIGKSAFNKDAYDNADVGYMYGNSDIVEPSEYSSEFLEKKDTLYISKEYTFDKNTKLFTLKNPIQVLGSNLTTDYIGYYYTDAPTSVPSSVSKLYKIMGVTTDDFKYVGIKYGYVYYGTSSKEVAQTNTNDSTIKTYIDNWYKTNIVGTTNEQYLADNIFCNDRTISSYNPGRYTNLGYGTESTIYVRAFGPWSAPSDTENAKMKFYCKQLNDSFTVQSSLGNTSLKYAISLLNKDELILSGLYNSGNSTKLNYLADGNYYWLISPDAFDEGAKVRNETANGEDCNGANVINGVKPVINLKPNSLKSGDGTINNPYVVE